MQFWSGAPDIKTPVHFCAGVGYSFYSSTRDASLKTISPCPIREWRMLTEIASGGAMNSSLIVTQYSSEPQMMTSRSWIIEFPEMFLNSARITERPSFLNVLVQTYVFP